MPRTRRQASKKIHDLDTMTHREILEALSGLLIVLLVALISSTIVSTALPRIIGALNGTQNQYTWVVTAALLAATASTPIWGRLADLFSKKLLVQVAIGIFVVGSLLCGFAQSGAQLIGFRVVQGIGAGGLQALVQVAIAAMIPPRERGRYNGYTGAVMAVATVAGPLVGGVIVDTSWLGWRWCFFIGVPIAAAAFLMLQATLHLPTVRLANVKIDYVGATLIAAGVSILLIWVSFVDNSFAWVSWQSTAFVGPGLLILALATLVEHRASQPVVPLRIVAQRTPALAILASVAVGMAIFGAAVFLGLYFQLGRGYGPTESGLLTVPLMFGVLVASTVSGQLVTRSGRLKGFVVAGTIVLVAGFLSLAFVDHDTPLVLVGTGMAVVGVGVGMTNMNLVLAVQNSVSLKDLGAASGAITFFRSLGGTVGVSVLGAVLAHRVQSTIMQGLAKAGLPSSGRGGGALNLAALPEPARGIIRAAYGDATGQVFLVCAAIGVAGIVAAVALPTVRLRSTIDLTAQAEAEPTSADTVTPMPDVSLDQHLAQPRRAGAPAGAKRHRWP